jgi:signal transduction histidine kinase
MSNKFNMPTNIVIDVAEDAEIDYPFRSTLFSLLEVTKNLVQTHDDQLKKKHLSVQISGGENIPQINADKTRLQFVMQIIFENAIIYTPQNGKIEIKIHFNNEKKEFIFSVSDSGIGINSNDLPKLFSKFYRTVSARHTDTEGMGIGLYMAKKIIINHNGRIWAESDGEGNGSTFFFAIPLKS